MNCRRRRLPPPLVFGWELYDQSISIPQFGANAIKHVFGLLSRRFVTIGSDYHRGRDQMVPGVIDVKPIFGHVRSRCD